MSWPKMGAERPQSGSKTLQGAPRRTKKALGRVQTVYWTLKNDSKPLWEISTMGFSLYTYLKNQYSRYILLKHTCVTSCNCLERLWSDLKLSWNHLGSVRKAVWSLQHISKPTQSVKTVFSLCTSFENDFWNNMLPKHTVVTSCRCLEELWSASKASWSHIGRLRKASWTLQNLFSADQ